MHFLLSRYCLLTFVRRQVAGRILNMCFAHMRPPPFNWSLSSPNDFYMFISVFLLCFLLYHMSPRDSVMTCARISMPHLLGSFSYSTTFYPTYLLLKSFRLGSFPYSTTFYPIFPAYAFFHWGVLRHFTFSPQPALIDCKLLW